MAGVMSSANSMFPVDKKAGCIDMFRGLLGWLPKREPQKYPDASVVSPESVTNKHPTNNDSLKTLPGHVAITTPATTARSLRIALVNRTSSGNVWAYINGLALDNNGRQFLLRSDAVTPYYPESPTSTGSPLGADCAIALGPPGSTTLATVPLLAGGRIWFSQGAKLTFLLNPAPPGGNSPGLVEPSIFNPSDPNINIDFTFCEFTFNTTQLFANITYVDFVSALPIALTLQEVNGNLLHTSGMGPNGLDTVCQALQAQSAKDGRRWRDLIVTRNGKNLRALSPNSGILLHPDWFQTYWTDYVNQVYSRYVTQSLTVNTQASYGDVRGTTKSADTLSFPNDIAFTKPTARDIFSCSTGPFATGSNDEENVIIPRLAAAFNRGTLLQINNVPNGETPSQYYKSATTNHYARIVHAANLDGKGYAFPYDDVTPDRGVPQEGAVNSGQPDMLTVEVGGNGAYVG